MFIHVSPHDHKHGQCHVGVKESYLHLDKKGLSTQGYKGLDTLSPGLQVNPVKVTL